MFKQILLISLAASSMSSGTIAPADTAEAPAAGGEQGNIT